MRIRLTFICIDNISDEIKERIADYSEKIKTAHFLHRAKPNARSSSVWNVFHEIIDDDGNAIDQFYFCTNCKTVEHSTRSGGSTTKLLRHPCVIPVERNLVNVNSRDLDKIKRAAAKFVCMDLRPINAIECSGLRELIWTGIELGKKYPVLTAEDFFQFFPSRNTVKSIIADEAIRAKNAIKILFRNSIKQGGLGCTLDLWSDSFKSNSYMAMTANVVLVSETCIQQKPLVFHMGYIEDIVKSKQVVKSRIIEVFNEFEVSTLEMKENVTITTDR